MSAQTAQIEPASQRPRHRHRHRLGIVAACVAAAVGVAAGAIPLAAHETDAHATTRLVAVTRLMHRLESEGYVATACTRGGTLMVDEKTGRRVIVTFA